MEAIKKYKFEVEVNGTEISITPTVGSQNYKDHLDVCYYLNYAIGCHVFNKLGSDYYLDYLRELQQQMNVVALSPNTPKPYKTIDEII